MSEENTAYEKLTPQRKLLYDAVMRYLENGTGIWEQGWEGGGGAPVSAISEKSYKGVNRLSLMVAAMERGYSDHRWMTFKQMTDKGWSFKRNEEGKSLGKNAGVTIEYFELRDKETKQPFDRHVLDGMTADERNEYMEENVCLHSFENSSKCGNGVQDIEAADGSWNTEMEGIGHNRSTEAGDL